MLGTDLLVGPTTNYMALVKTLPKWINIFVEYLAV